MLIQRTITALILFFLAVAAIFFTPPLVFAASCWLLCLIANYELAKMYRFNKLQIAVSMVINTLIAVCIGQVNYDLSQIIRIVSVATWCFAVPLVLIFTPKHFSKFAIAVFSGLLFIPAYYALTVLHALFGPWQLISIMAIAWVADTGAYFVGKQFGKHKLAPRISPGKSIEGAIGGLILVIIYLVALKYFNLADYLITYSMAFKFAAILTVISIAGDLFESWLKRVGGVKDSGSILPGHGGVFDRIDSLIAVLAIAFAIIRGML
ncbi:MAG: phosphatidate cytidylyltransferase [Burkholderiales bacterium]|nr:phosphatidate cytidylyltransferase [Burkholderiales bacterium]